MENNQNIRPQKESITELFTAIGSVLLALLLYLFFKMLGASGEVSSMLAIAAIPAVLAIVRFTLIRRGVPNREIREALAGRPAINPIFVCVAAGACIQLVQRFFTYILVISMAVGPVVEILEVVALENDRANTLRLNASEINDIILITAALPALILTFLSTWPIMQIATYYFHKWAFLWIVATVTFSQFLDFGIALFALHVLPVEMLGISREFRESMTWTTLTLLELASVPILLIPASIGYIIARKRRSHFLLKRAFKALPTDDQEAVLDLLMERRGITSRLGPNSES